MNHITKIGTLAILTLTLVAPLTGQAQTSKKRQAEIGKREKSKSEWQRAANAGAILAILGQLNKDKTASYVGAAGALYSAYRMEEDRKSSDRSKRALAATYSKSSFVSKGVRYDRKAVYKGGKKYYTFVRHRR